MWKLISNLKRHLAHTAWTIQSRCLLITSAESHPANVLHIWEITEFRLNILASFFVQPLFCVFNYLNLWWHTLFSQPEKPFLKKCLHTQQQLQPIQKLSAQNNGWAKKEAKIFRRNSVISQILHWLDWNRQLWSKDI